MLNRMRFLISIGVCLLFISPKLYARNFDLFVNPSGLISINANQVSVEELITALGEELDIEVSFPNPVQNRISVKFEELEFEQAIRQLTQSYILVTGKKTDPPAIQKIIVMPEGEASGYLPKDGNIAEQIRDSDESESIDGTVSSTTNGISRRLDRNRRTEAGLEESDIEDDAEFAEQPPPLPEEALEPELSQ